MKRVLRPRRLRITDQGPRSFSSKYPTVEELVFQSTELPSQGVCKQRVLRVRHGEKGEVPASLVWLPTAAALLLPVASLPLAAEGSCHFPTWNLPKVFHHTLSKNHILPFGLCALTPSPTPSPSRLSLTLAPLQVLNKLNPFPPQDFCMWCTLCLEYPSLHSLSLFLSSSSAWVWLPTR